MIGLTRVTRLLVFLPLLALHLSSCGPDKPRACSGEEPAFKVILRLTSRPLPADTVVHVGYAGTAKEDFRLSDPSARLKVTFCSVTDENGEPLDASAPLADGSAGSAGATSGSSDSEGVPALFCKLYTAGFTELTVTGTGFMAEPYQLRTDPDQCVVKKDLVLDAPDAGT